MSYNDQHPAGVRSVRRRMTMDSQLLDIQEALVRERLDKLAQEAADARLMVDTAGPGGSTKPRRVESARRWLGRSIAALGGVIEGSERRDESEDTAGGVA